MSKRAAIVRAVFKGLARLERGYAIEVGPVRATGVPAILLGVCGIVTAAGVAAFLSRSAGRLPETLSEAQGLAQTLRGDRPRLAP
ncbi:MAG TPA: hypothetical protein VMF11_03850 [Candidatus Baltobacteraceae bacterium]|nr:hypothetical protein [Candidatus Baltobacteraceae bacterium]